MKIKLLTRLAIATVLLFYGTNENVSGQETPFHPPANNASNMTINGDMKIIANAIIGLNGPQDQSNNFFAGDLTNYNPNDSYDGASYNDGLTVGYIDIDSDATTFSSSSADFTTSGSCAKIAYAGLYWSATYYIERDVNNNPLLTGLPIEDTRPNFKTIKFKPPGTVNYIDIVPGALKGNTEVLFDGYRNTVHNPNDTATPDIPYVCYADVTDIVKGLADPNGTYTVANVRSTIGKTELGAGASAGWTMVIIYEDPTLTPKHFSTNHGYEEIDGASPETFSYTNFQTVPTPLPVRVRFGVAALEGDYGIQGDGLSIKNTQGTQTALFANPVNNVDNFFNSSISVDGNFNVARNPASSNTLGFDADIFDIDNPGNFVIGNNQTSVDFTATTSGDRYRIFLNAFSAEVIESKLTVVKRVLDNNGIDITGGNVNLGDQLFYELTIENNGNENVINTTIVDAIPDNVGFITGTITADAGINATYDAIDNQLNITIDNSTVEHSDEPIVLRYGISVISNCRDLADACTNEIYSKAIFTYTGETSGITNSNRESVLSLDACQNDIEGATSFSIDLSNCNNFEAYLCSGATDIVAGDGFTNYVWTDLSNNQVVGNAQTLVVNNAGQYRVDKSGTPDCNNTSETWDVLEFNTITNPIVSIANDPQINGNIRTCSITGELLPELFLCGVIDSINLDSGFTNVTSIVWERLDPAACSSVIRDENCPTLDQACEASWTQVASTSSFTVTEAGEYRIRVEFEGNCNTNFYFNVFKNNFDPNLVMVREIICGTPGTLRVQNSSNQFEYQLVTPSGNTIGYQASEEFSGLIEEGIYTVNVREASGLPTTCVFQATQFMEALASTVTITTVNPDCAGDTGEIQIQVVDGQPTYIYNITNFTNAFTITEGPTTDPNHIFPNLDVGTYDVEVLSYDGECIENQQVIITEPIPITADIAITQNYGCDPSGSNVMPQLGKITISNPTGGNGNYEYSIDGIDFTNTTGIFSGLTDGTYSLYIRDTFTEACPVILGQLTIDPLQEVTDLFFVNSAVTCPGLTSDVKVSAIGTNGASNFEYRITAPSGSATAFSATNTYTLPVGNTYTFEARTIIDGCIYSEDFTIENIDFIVFNATITDEPSCNGDTNGAFLLTVGGIDLTSTTYSYEITGGSIVGAITGTGVSVAPTQITGIGAGTYTITVIDDITNCTESGNIVITEPEVLNFTAIPNDDYCNTNGGFIVINAAGGNGEYEYELRDSTNTIIIPYQTNNIFNGLASGAYTVVVRDGNSAAACEISEQVVISENLPLSIAVTGGDLCFDSIDEASVEVTITGGEGPFIYSINGDIPSVVATPIFTIANLTPGNYNVNVTDNNDCSSDTLVFKIEPELMITSSLTKDLDCGVNPDAIIDLITTGGYGANTFELNSNGGGYMPYTGQIPFTTATPGTYQFRVTDIEGCSTVSQPISITRANIPVATPTENHVLCSGESTGYVSITVDTSIGTAPYLISFNGGVFSTQTIYDSLVAGTYSFTVRDAKGCESTFSAIIWEPTPITFDVAVTPVTTDADGAIEISAAGGTPPYTYELREEMNGSVIAPYQTSNVFTIGTGGTYTINVSDANGCEVAQQVAVDSTTESPLLDYADEILFCAVTGQSYPVITIQDEAGEVLEIPFTNVLSIVWQKLDEISCGIELEENCPTTDSSCSSDWFTIASGAGCTITETGEYRVVIEFTNKSANTSVTYYFRANANVLGVDDLKGKDVSMYPNPASTMVSINTEVEQIKVYDVTGKNVLRTSRNTFNVSSLSKGVYFVKIENKNGKEVILKLMRE